MSQPERNILGVTIRTLFFQRKSVALGRPYKPSPRHDVVEYYRQAADQCIELKANPEDYISACFEESRGKFRQGPFANMLFGPQARRWYENYMLVRRGPPEEPRIRPVHGEPGEAEEVFEDDEPFIFTSTADLDVRFAIAQTQKSLNNLTGSPDHRTPENMDHLRDPLKSYPEIARVLLGFPDPEIMRRYGAEAIKVFRTRPDLRNAAENLNYPMKEILQWTSPRNSTKRS